LNWKLEEGEGVAEGDFGTVGAGSARLKAFRRKAASESISCIRISTAISGLNQEIRRQRQLEVQIFTAVATDPFLKNYEFKLLT
jgi:hypothetical protein